MGQTAEQVQEKLQPAVGQAQQKTEEMRARASGRVRQELDKRSTQAGEQAGTVADAVRTTAEQLRREGKEQPAKVADQAAERAEQLGGYLRQADADRIIRDAEEFARRRPWVVAAIGAGAGLLAARFVKAGRGGADEEQPSTGTGEPAELPPVGAAVATSAPVPIESASEV